ncbi:MAG: hypothetical protein ACI9MC_003943, partial [Kiritimatiellia bacterium]
MARSTSRGRQQIVDRPLLRMLKGLNELVVGSE